MSGFNQTKKNNSTISYEGGKTYLKNPTEDFLNFLFSCYLEDRYYESSGEQMNRFIKLADSVAAERGTEFVAKASMYARNELGIRSIAHLTAAWLNGQQLDCKRSYFKNFCHRPDDVAEVLAAIESIDGKRSHAMIRGFADYLSTLKPYQIDKYKMMNKEYNLYDCINICHPKSRYINQYMKGTMQPAADTWEKRISATEGDQEKKNKAWRELVIEGKLGYLALIRNLRNILATNITPYEIEDYLVAQLINEKAIKQSLVMPYQIYCAFKNLDRYNYNRSVDNALSEAFMIACGNMPQLEGRSLVMLDVSGSMEDHISRHSNMTIKEVGAVYAAALCLTGADFIKFGTKAKKGNYSFFNVFELIKLLQKNDNLGYGTHIDSAFNIIDRHYDRIFLISDMQIMSSQFMSPQGYFWSGANGIDSYKDYVVNYGRCKMYSFDLGNYYSQYENPNNPDIKLFTALNDKVFKFIDLVERGQDIAQYIDDNFDYRH